MAFRDKLRSIFLVKDTPHRIAMAFALGVFIGISPIFGIHAISALFLSWLLGLNRLVAVVGVCVTNPWTIVPIYSFSLWVGARLIGIKQILPEVDWADVTFMSLISKLTPLILPFVTGTLIVGAISSFASYFIIYSLILRYRNMMKDGP